MYTIDWDQVSTLVGDKVIPKIRDQYFKSNALMYRLRPRAKMFTGGRSLVQPLSFAPEGGGGQWWSGTDKFDIRIRNPITSAQFWAKNFVLPVVVTQDDEDTVDGPQKVFDLVEAKMTIARRTIMDSLGGANGIYNDGSNPKAITGLQYALADYTSAAPGVPPTAQYGGINASPTLNTWWNHQGNNTAFTTGIAGSYVWGTNMAPWNNMFAAQGLAAGKTSSLILCNWGVWNELLGMVHDKTTFFRPQQNDQMVKAGFTTMSYNGKDIFVDEQVPRNTSTKVEKVYFIDEDAMDFWVHAARNFRFSGFQEMIEQAVRVGKIWFRGELTFSERRSSGVHSSVNTTSTSP